MPQCGHVCVHSHLPFDLQSSLQQDEELKCGCSCTASLASVYPVPVHGYYIGAYCCITVAGFHTGFFFFAGGARGGGTFLGEQMSF